MKLARLLGSLIAVALAPVLAVQAHVNAGGQAFARATAWNGFQLADRAESQVEATQVQGRLQLKASAETIEIAKQAYAQEPFATDALFVIGSMNGKNGMDIYRSSVALDKRNRTIAAMLLQDAAKRNDLPAMLALIARLSQLRPAFASEFVKAFSGSLVDPQSLPVLESALKEVPVWAPAFWRSVPRDPAALDNFVLLRRKISAGTNAESDAALIGMLVDTGRYAEAFELRKTLALPPQSVLGETSGKDAPLAWRLAQSRDAQARFNAAGELEIFIERGTGGELARQLVRLSPGKLQLMGRTELQQGAGTLETELTCASGKSEGRWKAQPLGSGQGWEISSGSCPYAWLILKGAAWDSQLPLRATIGPLSIVER